MEHAGRLIPKLKGKSALTPAELCMAAWPSVIGKRLANRARAVALVDGRLIVDVEDALWQRNLEALREPIMANFEKTLGGRAPREVEFRVGVPRRPPARAVPPAAEPAAGPLRSIDRIPRRKAGA
ncbi:MAG: DUF721 domain-containing protein [Bryobacteraceae bacterium]|nr:DUF721 domain-containing protein [Bryobacteraceae bacterium]